MGLRHFSTKEQNIYIQRLKDKALAEALRRAESPQTVIPFDLQGRIILNVVFSQEDVDDILKKAPEQNPDVWQTLIGHNTTVDLDIQEHPKLQEAFEKQLLKAVEHYVQKKDKHKDILSAFNDTPKDEVIGLQQAAQSYVLSAINVYQESAVFKDKSASLEEAGLQAMEEVNKMILETYARALSLAYKDNRIELHILNKELERIRKNIPIYANQFLQNSIFQKTGVQCDRELVRKPLENLANRMSKSPNERETLQTDYTRGLITWTEAYPAVQVGQATHDEARLIITNDYNKQGQIIEKTPQESKRFHKDIQREILQHQVGKYKEPNVRNEQVVNSQLTNAIAKENLYKGIDLYKKNHLEQIKSYCKLYKMDSTSIDKPDFFRQQFIEYVMSRELPKYAIPAVDPRKTRPEEATIKLAEFLGPRGAELYRLALEEERYSQEYMNAVFCASTEHYEGEPWSRRPVILVGGPSSSGKSFAAQAAVLKANELVPKKPASPGTTPAGNDVVSVDGGVFRQVSQMRKLAIRLSNQQGYTGISNLHEESNILDQAKTCLKKALYAAPSVGVVLPETFSNPLRVTSILEEIEGLPNTKMIFTRVEGEYPDIFQRVVGYLGSRRAWKTDWSSETVWDLNSTEDLSESKAYGSFGFFWGQRGSSQAEEWYIKNSTEPCCFHIFNDLLLIRPVTLSAGLSKREQWVDANPGDAEAVKVSRRLYEAWIESDEPSLNKFIQGKDKSLPALIVSDGQYNMKKVIQKLNQKWEQYKNEGNKEWTDRMERALLIIGNVKTKDDFPKAITQIQELIPVRRLSFTRSPREELMEVVKVLEQCQAESNSSQTFSQEAKALNPNMLFSNTDNQTQSPKQPISGVFKKSQ